MIKGFVKHFRINVSDIKKIEQRFDDNFYITIEYFNTLFNSLHIFTLLLLYIQSILSCTLNLIMMTWSHRNVILFLYRLYLFHDNNYYCGTCSFTIFSDIASPSNDCYNVISIRFLPTRYSEKLQHGVCMCLENYCALYTGKITLLRFQLEN